jgi:hypothetical protein
MNGTVGSRDLHMGCREATNASESFLRLPVACKVGFREQKVKRRGKVTVPLRYGFYRL